jgi:hypothetical protein
VFLFMVLKIPLLVFVFRFSFVMFSCDIIFSFLIIFFFGKRFLGVFEQPCFQASLVSSLVGGELL